MLIQLEGNEASGKSTLLKALFDALCADTRFKNFTIGTAHLPSSSTEFGLIARDILNHKDTYLKPLYSPVSEPVPRELVLTLTAYLDQYIHNTNLNRHVINLQSRGIISNLVYSDLSTTNLDSSLTQYILPLITLLPKPELIVYLGVPNNELIRRLTTRKEQASIYDKAELIELIRARYEKVINLFPSWNILVVSGTLSTEQIVYKVTEEIAGLLNKHE